MKRLFFVSMIVAVVLIFSSSALAQTENTESTANNANIVIAQGATAKLSLQSQLSSKISEVGDEVTAVLYEPVRSADGRVAIPRGTEFIGRVTQVQAAKRPQKEATMTIVFEKMRMSYGTEKISTVVTAIDDFANDEKMRSKNDEGKVGGGKSGSRTAKNAGIGGGIGSLGGVLIGAAGGGLGGVAGGIGGGVLGGVLMTKGNDIKLAPGTILRIRFEHEVALPAFEATR
ncbi:MAG: hypothetical protein JST85_10315 [Acidobacteria bacterium]|nr:hypothetical protein [Acidobacteriota bacterium]